jgi:heat-inducible transcriptional repressor
MLDDRKTAILSAVVQEYIATAQPVGSTHIAEAPTIKVSSATVRNEMAHLEHEGYLVQPHTSAGRIPTDKGYRYFVDHLTRPGRLDQATTKQVGEFFSAAHGRLEEMLHQTSNLLANLTRERWRRRRPEGRGDPGAPRAVGVAVGTGGHGGRGVRQRHGRERHDRTGRGRRRPEAQRVRGPPLRRTRRPGPRIGHRGQPDRRRRGRPAQCSRLAALQATAGPEHVFTGGAAAVANAFDAVEVVRTVLATLEQQFVVVTLVSDIVNRGMSVAIGVEHGVEPLSSCSVVVAPVVVDGEHLGSVGVLGPTRMNYPQALATVEVVSEQLGHRIEEG